MFSIAQIELTRTKYTFENLPAQPVFKYFYDYRHFFFYIHLLSELSPGVLLTQNKSCGYTSQMLYWKKIAKTTVTEGIYQTAFKLVRRRNIRNTGGWSQYKNDANEKLIVETVTHATKQASYI